MKYGSQRCSICSREVMPSERYPLYVCRDCCTRASDADGRPLVFMNDNSPAGIVGNYRDTGEEYPGQICYVSGVKCWADEAHMGGIVIEPYVEKN